MPIAFLDLVQTCAPLVAPEILAGVVSLESRFAPFHIRINSGHPLKRQPSSKTEAIEVATSLIAERHGLQLGLGGIGVAELQKLKLSVSDAFDPCVNLQATAVLLDGYYRLAIKAGADSARAEQVMLRSYYGRDDPSVGAMVNYDGHVRQETKRLLPIMAKLTIGDMGEGRKVSSIYESSAVGAVAEMVAGNGEPETASAAAPPRWDVFKSRRWSSALVFQNNQMEQSE